MKTNNPTYIPNELANAATNGFVVSTEQVRDYLSGKSQEQFNSDTTTDITRIEEKTDENRAEINRKQFEADALVIDAQPTPNSENFVRSGSIYNAIRQVQEDLANEIVDYRSKNYKLTEEGKFGSNTSNKHTDIPVVEGEKYIILNNSNSVDLEYALTTNNSYSSGGDIPLIAGASVVVLSPKESHLITIPTTCNYLMFGYPGGNYDYEPKVYKYGNEIKEVKAGLNLEDLKISSVASDGLYIDYDHMCNYSTNPVTLISYRYDEDYDAAWVILNKDATTVKFSGWSSDTPRVSYFSTYNPSVDSFLGTNTSGSIISGAKLAVVNILKSNYPNGYDGFRITQDGGYLNQNQVSGIVSPINLELAKLKPLSNGLYIDYKHYVNAEAGDHNYYTTNNFDAIWIPIQDSHITNIQLDGEGFTTLGYRFFSSYEPSQETYVGHNTTGDVISNAKLAICNASRETHDDYSGVRLYTTTDYATKGDIAGMFGDATIIKNIINVNDLYYGYWYNASKWEAHSGSVSSNKIVFNDGVTYAFQNILGYGKTPKIYVVHFDDEDNCLGSSSVKVNREEGAIVGNALYTYHKEKHPGTAYCRVMLRTLSTQSINFNNCQIEVGDKYTEVVDYAAKMGFVQKEVTERKVVKLLIVGNSYSQDALAYVPFIMQNMDVPVDFQLGILMQSSATVSMHIDNFENETAAYTFNYYNGGVSWTSFSSKTIQWALDNYQWDLIVLQGAPNTEDHAGYFPKVVKLTNLLSSYVDYTLKFVWYQTIVRPASSNGNSYPENPDAGKNRSEENQLARYEAGVVFAQKCMNEAIFEHLIPVGTAVRNARTIATLDAMGDYSTHPNNNSGKGYLCPYDGVHLQEGLPCQIAAYTFILAILDIYGYKEYSVLGETTRVDSDWETGKSIPSPHGTPIGSTDENCLIAQKCAIMAVKHPYEITDMNPIINPVIPS